MTYEYRRGLVIARPITSMLFLEFPLPRFWHPHRFSTRSRLKRIWRANQRKKAKMSGKCGLLKLAPNVISEGGIDIRGGGLQNQFRP
jgi:hypothetical protein